MHGCLDSRDQSSSILSRSCYRYINKELMVSKVGRQRIDELFLGLDTLIVMILGLNF
jgi:hypothetical protein